jgi:predicted  nucleic acid-binding Zn-ribbon protein
MASDDLRRLWRLHLIDAALVEIQQRAASLDPGRALIAEIKALEAQLDEKGGQARTLASELTDTELKQRSIEDKLKKVEKEIFGGKVVNPREIEALEKEVGIIKRQRTEVEARILELWELVPPAQAEADGIETALAEKKHLLSLHQKQALRTKAQLESDYKARMAERPAAVKAVPGHLLTRYDSIRKGHHGIAMGQITRGRTCSACGTHLPERTIQGAKEEKIMTCDECHRILYFTEGLV